MVAGKSLKESVSLVSRSYDRILRKQNKFRKEDVLSAYLNSFAHSLDPHSSYFSADALEDFEIQMSLSLEGIGATLTSEDGFTVVESLVKGGAADRSGKIFPKDKIIAVGQFKKGKSQAFENVMEWDLRDVVRIIRGKKGSRVNLKILRRSKGKAKHHIITLVRDKIKLEDEAARLTFSTKRSTESNESWALSIFPLFMLRARGIDPVPEMLKILLRKRKHPGSMA